MDIQIEQVDTPTAPESLLREMHEHYVGVDAEQLPDDPPTPFEHRLAIWRFIPEHNDIRRWILREDNEIAGAALVVMNKHEDLNNGFVRIHVRPESRKRGHAIRLAFPVLETLEANERGSVITDVRDGSSWEPKLKEIGLKKAFEDKTSRLLVEDIDWSLMDSWIERAAERAGEYDLLLLRTPIEERYLQKWCDLMLVMNTAPKEDLEFEDLSMSPEKWRDIEKQDLLRGQRLVAFVAVHKASGSFVGVSEISESTHQPDLAWQGDTGVDPKHQNKGLGRWLKAAMIKQFVADHPNVERIDTDNAGSNRPMLNINIAMGYKQILINNAWQGDVETVKARLGI
ncbi:MAG: GNAT family N-acetyltransferase [Acidobacteria bacterium]|nr:GNAT family N-acetyltransferase [Acidobacteriota bacterium]TDI50874.1 MAG: GNAT family N-acetyltransferase [Acidobacteriota bacterium]TDI52774.1 MAG: GNAT family N-acetyltransferase [Acidobacteriota bacterium]TDI55104.1 MAG: GNAT family N-acetyltransferase [Acidobacteriota bacterium]